MSESEFSCSLYYVQLIGWMVSLYFVAQVKYICYSLSFAPVITIVVVEEEKSVTKCVLIS